MDKDITAEEKLKQLEAERKGLKEQIKDEREVRLEEAAKMRVIRDERIETLQERVKKILAVIFQYNKLGKVAKVEFDILNKILEEIHRAPDAPEEDVVADSANN